VEPSVRLTVDIVIFAVRSGSLQVLLIRRGIEPFRGAWAIPGGFVLDGEGLEDAARRELREETGVEEVYLEQLYTFGDPGRDPRGRVVSVAYFALLSGEGSTLVAGTDAAEAAWWRMDQLPDLAFDHAPILAYALDRLRNKIEYTTVGFQLLPEKFSLTALQRVYEMILGRPLDKRNFRRKLTVLQIVKPLKELDRTGNHRPARLYQLRKLSPEKLRDRGVLMPF
jgi:8-oxo-dGTP diphosphatase